MSGDVTTYTYDAGNRLLTEDEAGAVTTYSYDAAGNRTRKDAPSTLTDYTWDAKNRLTKVAPVAGDVDFTYTASGQRVKKVTPSETKNFIYDFERLLQEMDATDDPTRLYNYTEHGYSNHETVNSGYGDLVSEYGGSDGSLAKIRGESSFPLVCNAGRPLFSAWRVPLQLPLRNDKPADTRFVTILLRAPNAIHATRPTQGQRLANRRLKLEAR